MHDYGMTNNLLHTANVPSLFDQFDCPALEDDGGTIYGLWPDLTLAYFNPGWTRFAEQNGGEPQISAEWNLGRCILDAIPDPLRAFFVSNYAKCLREGRPWEHTYECSSPELFRLFHMMVFPVKNGAGLLVVNSKRQESPHKRTPHLPLEELYRNEHGIVAQCCHCRRIRRAGSDQVWDWVPAWVKAQPPNTSHGLCAPCYGYYYSPDKDDRRGFAIPFETEEDGLRSVPQ